MVSVDNFALSTKNRFAGHKDNRLVQAGPMCGDVFGLLSYSVGMSKLRAALILGIVRKSLELFMGPKEGVDDRFVV